MSKQPFFSIRDYRLNFNTFDGVYQVLDGVNLDLERGQSLGIVGETGCGKSVTIRNILGLLPSPPAEVISGQILFEGRDLLKVSKAEMQLIRGIEIAMIFQDPMTYLNPVFTIGNQMIDVILAHQRNKPRANKMSRRQAGEHAIEMLRKVHLPNPDKQMNSYPHQLSGGMRQRVLIATALSGNPKLLVADEPTTALDVTIQAQILELMKNLTRDFGVAMIIITHNLGVVARYADRVNVMYAGKIIETGTAKDIYHTPKHPYTLALLKSVPRIDQPRVAKLDPVQGQPPDLSKLDGGCAFRPRCRYATDKCAQSIPELEKIDGVHAAACFRHNELEEV